MATLEKTWTHDVNNAVANTLTQTEQYQTLWLALHNLFVNAGYTVVVSSDGVTAGAGNNITTLADVVVGGVSANHTWALYEWPVAAQQEGQILFEAQDTATTQPQDAEFSLAAAPFDISSIAPNSRPVSPALADQKVENVTFILRDWTTPVDGAWHGMYSDIGDVYFFARRQTQTFMETEVWFRADTPAGAGTDAGNLAVFRVANPSGALNSGFPGLGSIASACGCFMQFGPLMSSRISGVGPAAATSNVGIHNSSWTDGLDDSGTLLTFDFGWASAADPYRYLGRWVDVRAVSTQTDIGTVEDGDTDPLRYVCIAGAIMVPWPSTEFPIL